MSKLSVIILTILIYSWLSFLNFTAQAAQDKITFWNQARKGAHIFNRRISREDIVAAKNHGIAFIRLAPDKFLSTKRDFLIGTADHYTKLVSEDLKTLIDVLDMCAEEQMPIVLTMLSLPGSRWNQNNNGKDDLRLWNDTHFQHQAAKFWKDIAIKLQGHPAVVGYNILNEPHPERLYDAAGMHIDEINQGDIQQKLFKFYKLVIENIRISDKNTPIILDSSAYADPKTFRYLKVHNDAHILYSFHMYELYEYTNCKTNKGQFS